MVHSQCGKSFIFYTIFKKAIQSKKRLEITKTIAFRATRQSQLFRPAPFMKNDVNPMGYFLN